MSRFLMAVTLALVPLASFAQKSVRPAVPVDLGTESMSWAAGVSYSYDDSGNIRAIGSDAYLYDAVAFGNRWGLPARCRQLPVQCDRRD